MDSNDQRHNVEEVTPEFWDRCIHVDLRHQVFAAQAVVDDMVALGGGSIVNLGSTSWMAKGAGYPAYATTKAAIHGWRMDVTSGSGWSRGRQPAGQETLDGPRGTGHSSLRTTRCGHRRP